MSATASRGSERRQALLREIREAWAGDVRIVTIGVFGSSTRSNADEWSDIDLDVTVRAGDMPQAAEQIRQLENYLRTCGHRILLSVWKGPNWAEFLLDTLERIDVTVHTPEASKSEVLRELALLRGERGDLPEQGRPAISPDESERVLRLEHEEMPLRALYAAIALRRGRRWEALEFLEQMREGMMAIYGLARGSSLPKRYFRREAEPELQAALGQTLAQYERESIAGALRQMMALYQSQCEQISDGRLRVSEAQAEVFGRVEELVGE